MPHPSMQNFASTRETDPARDARRAPLRALPTAHRAYRERLAALRSRAPDTLRARIRRELRAAADPARRP